MFDKSIVVFFIAAFKFSPLQPIGYGHNLHNIFWQIQDISRIVVYRWIRNTRKQEYDVAASWNKEKLEWRLSEVSGEIGLDRISDEELLEMRGIYERTC